jgi:hypothetical protein
VEHAVIRIVVALSALFAIGCGARRHLDVEFTSEKPGDVDAITRVDVQIFDGKTCACSELGTKQGCLDADAVSSITFTPQDGNRRGGGFPDGDLVIKGTAYDAAQAQISLRIACWCVPDRADQTVIFPLGMPTDPRGTGCSR